MAFLCIRKLTSKFWRSDLEQPAQQTETTEETQHENKHSTTSFSTGKPAPHARALQKEGSRYLMDGQTATVWKPNISLQSVIKCRCLHERRKQLQNRVWAAQQVLNVHRKISRNESVSNDRESTTEELIKQRKAITEGARRTTKRMPSLVDFHDIVSEFAAAAHGEDGSEPQARETAQNSLQQWRRHFSSSDY